MYINAQHELIEHMKGKEILCADITYSESYGSDTNIQLRVGYTTEELTIFLSKLCFQYDNSYGRQYIYGKVWYKDGSWSGRGEYDGSEWWNDNTTPEIPEALR